MAAKFAMPDFMMMDELLSDEEMTIRDTVREFRLGHLECFGCRCLVTALDSGLDILYECANAAHAIAVDDGTALVAADALAGLRRIGHETLRPLFRSAAFGACR